MIDAREGVAFMCLTPDLRNIILEGGLSGALYGDPSCGCAVYNNVVDTESFKKMIHNGFILSPELSKLNKDRECSNSSISRCVKIDDYQLVVDVLNAQSVCVRICRKFYVDSSSVGGSSIKVKKYDFYDNDDVSFRISSGIMHKLARKALLSYCISNNKQ